MALAVIFPVAASQKVSVTLGWDVLADFDVKGYTVYYGTNTLQYTGSRFVSTPTATIPGLTAGEVYYFAVSASSVSGLESPLSDEIMVEIPLINLSLSFLPLAGESSAFHMWFEPYPGRTHELQVSTDLKVWRVLDVIPASSAPPRYSFVDYPTASSHNRYYRVMVRPP